MPLTNHPTCPWAAKYPPASFARRPRKNDSASTPPTNATKIPTASGDAS